MVHKGPIIITSPEAHYAAVGQLALNWAALEAIVTSAIWQIGGMEDEIGACVTSQISNFDAKIKALVSILEVRGRLKKVVEEVNEFHRHIRPLATFRNRLIHDPLSFDPTTGASRRLEITADKLLVLGYKDAPTDEVLSHAKKIADMIDRFGLIMKPALERYRPKPSPEKSKRNNRHRESDTPPKRSSSGR